MFSKYTLRNMSMQDHVSQLRHSPARGVFRTSFNCCDLPFRGLASLWTATFFDKFKKSLVYTGLIYFRNFAILSIAYLKRNKKTS